MFHPRRVMTRTRMSATTTLALLLLLMTLPAAPRASGAAGRGIQTSNIRAAASGRGYRQTNLVSSQPGLAPVFDPPLINPWGVVAGPGTPMCVANRADREAQCFRGILGGGALVRSESLPAISIPGGPPVAAVVNTTGDFKIAPPGGSPVPAQFIFFVEVDGGPGNDNLFAAWQPALGGTAQAVGPTRFGNTVYSGLAVGSNADGSRLYAVDFPKGIDVFDGSFNQTTIPGGFADPTVPPGYLPYNIANLNGSLYVTYAQRGVGVEGVSNSDGRGVVRKFDMNGVRDPAFAIDPGNHLNAPWGLAIAPASFGRFGGALLVGNFSDRFEPFNQLNPASQGGRINAYDKETGAFLGTLQDDAGVPIEIDGLRALTFGSVDAGTDPGTLYFEAAFGVDPEEEQAGLIGAIKPSASPATSTFQFGQAEYDINEGDSADVTVTRSGDLSGAARVDYATINPRSFNEASPQSDYEIALGTLTFNPGETSHTFRVLTVNDTYSEGDERIPLALANPSDNACLGAQNTASVKIAASDIPLPQKPTPIDDPGFFVRQHYYDFLGREPDTSGFNFWVNNITTCGSDAQCVRVKRVNVSAAFFLSIEFQQTGMLAYLANGAAFGAQAAQDAGGPAPVPVLYGQFERDVQQLQRNFVFGQPGADAQLEADKRAYFDGFVERPEFVNKFDALSNLNYVTALLTNNHLATSVGNIALARLDASQESPPDDSPAAGLLILRRDPFTPTHARVSLSLGNLTSPVTGVTINGPARPGANAPVLFSLPPGEFTDAQITLTAPDQIDSLNGGDLYVNVQTRNHPEGEIRGQIPPVRFRADVLTHALDDGTLTRAQVLRIVAESEELRQAEFDRAFVLMQYFGYLRRDPDAAGFQFWLDKLNAANGNFVQAEMVRAFIESAEYRRKFGPA